MKKLLAILLAALMLASVTACSPELDGSDISAVQIEKEEIDKYFAVDTGTFTYEYVDSASVRIINYDGKIELHDLVIPSVMNDKAVVEIAEDAFDYCSNLKTVTVPSSVKVIGKNAFAFCGKLISVSIPASLTTLGSSAFAFCNSLEKVAFTNTENAALKVIGNSAFHGCSALSEINLPATVTEIGTGAFFKCEVLYTLELPASLTKIGAQAFDSCTSLRVLVMPEALTLCEAHAFAKCNSLVEVTFENTERWSADVSTSESAYNALVKGFQNDLVKAPVEAQ